MAASSYKLIVVIDDTLCMSPGKIAAQCVHASLAALRKCTNTKWVSHWRQQGEPVIVLTTKDAIIDFSNIEKASSHLKIPYAEIHDAGRTCVAPNTLTCVGIGPAPSVMLNTFTSSFKLL